MAGGLNLSGGCRVIATYAKYLQLRGHDVHVVSRPPKSIPLKQQVRSLLKGEGLIPPRRRQASHFDNLGISYSLIDRPRPIVDSDVPDADVVIATWWETAEWVANLSESKGAKAYFIQHYETFDYLPKERVEASYLLPLHKIIVSRWLVDMMRIHYNDTHVSLVPNSVDLTQFNAPPRGKQPVPTFGVMYSTLPWKGCDVSLKAFSIAAERVANLQLLAFGCSQPSPDLPLPPKTKFFNTPPQTALRDIYSKCDAWLFGSRSEGFGLPILEAMACRTPVIGTPTGAALDLLPQGGGLVVNADDPEAMARAIEQICNLSEQEWRRMSSAAYTKASSYTWDDATTLFEAALHTATDRKYQKRKTKTHDRLNLLNS